MVRIVKAAHEQEKKKVAQGGICINSVVLPVKLADSYDKKMKTIGANAYWFESQQKFEVKKQKKINDSNISKELTHTHKDIKKHRFFQLKELYLQEFTKTSITEYSLSSRL